jgi:hypothetical protein
MNFSAEVHVGLSSGFGHFTPLTRRHGFDALSILFNNCLDFDLLSISFNNFLDSSIQDFLER